MEIAIKMEKNIYFWEYQFLKKKKNMTVKVEVNSNSKIATSFNSLYVWRKEKKLNKVEGNSNIEFFMPQKYVCEVSMYACSTVNVFSSYYHY